jgi:hypothetical protein
MSAQQMKNVFDHLSDVIERDILTVFKGEFRDDYRVTIICRHTKLPTANVFVSSDTEEGARSAIDHAFSPAAIEVK